MCDAEDREDIGLVLGKRYLRTSRKLPVSVALKPGENIGSISNPIVSSATSTNSFIKAIFIFLSFQIGSD